MEMNSHPSGYRTFSSIPLPAVVFLTVHGQAQQADGIPLWVWILLIILVILIAGYFFLARRPESPQEEPESRPYAAPTAADDLTLIEGIGPKISGVLNSAGITTFNQLAATDTARLQEILDQNELRLADPQTWPEQAGLAAAGDKEGLEALQERLKGGRVA